MATPTCALQSRSFDRKGIETKDGCKLLIVKRRREWDSNSEEAFRMCKFLIRHCCNCRICQRCRRALPKLLKTSGPVNTRWLSYGTCCVSPHVNHLLGGRVLHRAGSRSNRTDAFLDSRPDRADTSLVLSPGTVTVLCRGNLEGLQGVVT
jgi:hypothetical protein